MEASTASNNKNNEQSTVEKLMEAMALIKALAPKEAPGDIFLIKGSTGLNIIKNEALPEDAVIVSKRLFDLIFESAKPNQEIKNNDQ